MVKGLVNSYLSRTPLAPASDIESVVDAPCSYLALVILDAQARILSAFWNGAEGSAIEKLLCTGDSRLREDIAALVSELIATDCSLADNSLRPVSCVVMRDGGRTLRFSPMSGPDGRLYALVMETDVHAGMLARIARSYSLTRRQTEVLALVLDGASASDVARALVISEYTAQGYVKSLLAKTGSRNRAAMVAKVLNWNAGRAQAAGSDVHSASGERAAVAGSRLA
jgi:DNA-binding CsgD family transcriptional regulator